jgi:hypothetical protein
MVLLPLPVTPAMTYVVSNGLLGWSGATLPIAAWPARPPVVTGALRTHQRGESQIRTQADALSCCFTIGLICDSCYIAESRSKLETDLQAVPVQVQLEVLMNPDSTAAGTQFADHATAFTAE